MRRLFAAALTALCAGVAQAQVATDQGGAVTSIVGSRNIVYGGVGGPPSVWFSVYGKTLSGNIATPDATGTTSPLQFYIGSDTVTGLGLAAMQVEDGLATGFAGGRIAIQGKLVVNGVPSVSPPTGLTGVTGQTTLNANLLGATGAYSNYLGTGFGGNSQIIATGAATFVSIVNGHEFDVELQTNGSAAEKHGATIVATAGDAVQAVYDDSALEFADQDQANFVGWKTIVQFGGYAHKAPSNSSTTLIGIQNRVVPSPATLAAGIGVDMTNGSFTTAQFKGTGWLSDPNGNSLFTATTAPTMAAGTVAISGLIAAPTLGANDEGVAFVTAANGLSLEGQGSTYDVAIYDDAGAVAAGVVHGSAWFTVPNFEGIGTATFLTSGDVLSVSKSNNGDGGMTITNPAGTGNTAAFTAINIGNSTSVNEALISLNGGSSTATNGANALTISGAGVLVLQGGSNTQGTDVGFKITTGTVSMPGVATGTPAASLCIDASNNIIKKTTTGSCI